MKPASAHLYIAPHVRAYCAEPDHSDREWKAILTAQSFRCFYCSLPVNEETVTKDHLHPLFRGGCNCVGNLVGACHKCNSMKKEMTVREFIYARPSFLRSIGEFSTRILLLSGNALFYYRIQPLVHRVAVQKQFPSPIPATSERNRQMRAIARKAGA